MGELLALIADHSCDFAMQFLLRSVFTTFIPRKQTGPHWYTRGAKEAIHIRISIGIVEFLNLRYLRSRNKTAYIGQCGLYENNIYIPEY